MNNDLISRKALKQAVERIKDTGYGTNNEPLFDFVELPTLFKLIDKAPTVEPERSKGEWIDTGSGQECNVCHEIQYGYDNFRHFCTNCGADMRGGAE